MRPLLRPGLAIAWRTPGSLQLGVDDPEPLVLSGLSDGCRTAIGLMDGTRTIDQIAERVPSCRRDDLADLVFRLHTAGALIDAGRWPGGKGVPAARRERLLPDLMASAPSDPDHWWTALSRTHVTVVGVSRLGAIVARALSESGIGRVTVDDQRPVTPADVALGGFTSQDVGSARSDLLRSHPGPPVPTSRRRPVRQLVVLTDAVDVDAHATALTTRRATYLVASCRERTGQVGPLVEPGLSACHFCVELHRRDHDPTWPEVWRQRTWDSSPVALSTTAAITAHVAVSHVLGWALGEPVPSMRGVVEVDGRVAESGFRATPLHPECGCTWTPLAS